MEAGCYYSRMKTLAFGALAATMVLGCSARLSSTSQSCFTDSDCGLGSSCDPFTKLCVKNQKPNTVADAGVATDEGPVAEVCPAGESCNDNDPCTHTDVCSNDGQCAGLPYACGDDFDCTIDACDGAGGCAYTVTAGACLINGVCRLAADHNPVNGCQSCLPSVSLHTWTNDDTQSCGGDECNEAGACSDGQCLAGSAVSCDDDVPCTMDTCDLEAGCVSAVDDAACNDGDACTTDSCDAETGCQNDALTCEDDHACTTDTCDTEAGCQFTANDAECDDKDDCTTDVCDPGTGCVSTPMEDCPPSPVP